MLYEVITLVVQDIFLTETARLANVVLPAVSFAEKDGTFTNTERRVQRVRKAIEPVGQARPDWEILADLATRMGSPMSYDSAEAVFEEIRALTPSYAGITYERIVITSYSIHYTKLYEPFPSALPPPPNPES